MIDSVLYQLPGLLYQRLDVGWTLLLLMSRYTAMMMILPGVGGSASGLAVRAPAVLLLALATLDINHTTAVPSDLALLAAQTFTEFLFGSIVATVPLLIVSGASTAGQIASTGIGLNGAQMFDPTTNTAASDLSRIYGDLAVILFLSLNGHHVAIAQLAGLGDVVQPGMFLVSGAGIESLIEQSAKIFEIGVMIASPVIVALFLVNFVMGLLAKMVAQFNVFMMSFYITIAIGLVLSMLALPEVIVYLRQHFMELEAATSAVTR